MEQFPTIDEGRELAEVIAKDPVAKWSLRQQNFRKGDLFVGDSDADLQAALRESMATEDVKASKIHAGLLEALDQRLLSRPGGPIKRFPVDGDGHCLYKSLANQSITRHPDKGLRTWQGLRRSSADWCEQNPDRKILVPLRGGEVWETCIRELVDKHECRTFDQQSRLTVITDPQEKSDLARCFDDENMRDPETAFAQWISNVRDTGQNFVTWGDEKNIYSLAEVLHMPIQIISHWGADFDQTFFPSAFTQRDKDRAVMNHQVYTIVRQSDKHFESTVPTIPSQRTLVAERRWVHMLTCDPREPMFLHNLPSSLGGTAHAPIVGHAAETSSAFVWDLETGLHLLLGVDMESFERIGSATLNPTAHDFSFERRLRQHLIGSKCDPVPNELQIRDKLFHLMQQYGPDRVHFERCKNALQSRHTMFRMQQEQGTQDTFHSINTMPRKSRKPREPHHKDTTSQHFYYSKWLGTIDFEIHPPQNSKTASNTQSVSTEELSSPPPASDVALLPPPSASEPELQDQDSDGEDDCWIVDPSEPETSKRHDPSPAVVKRGLQFSPQSARKKPDNKRTPQKMRRNRDASDKKQIMMSDHDVSMASGSQDESSGDSSEFLLGPRRAFMTTRHVTEGKKMETFDDSDSSGDCVLIPTCDVTEAKKKETSDDSDSGDCVFVPSTGDPPATKRDDVSNVKGNQCQTQKSSKANPTSQQRRQCFGAFAPVAMDMQKGEKASVVFQTAQNIAHGLGFQITTKRGRNNKNMTLSCPASECLWNLPLTNHQGTWLGSCPLDKRSKADFHHKNPLQDGGGCVSLKLGVSEASKLLHRLDPHGNYAGLKFKQAASHFKLKTGVDVSNAVAWRAMGQGSPEDREQEWTSQFTKIDAWHDYINGEFPGSNCVAEYHTYLDENGNVLMDETGRPLEYFHRSFFTITSLRQSAESSGCDLIEIDGGHLSKNDLKSYKILMLVMGTGNLTNLIVGSAIVPSENHADVSWFLQQMKSAGWDFVLCNRMPYERMLACLSDDGTPLRTALEVDVPNASHRLCLKHIENRLETLPGRKLHVSTLMRYLHAAAKCSQEEESDIVIRALRRVDPVVANYVENKRPQWSLYTAVHQNLRTRGVVASNKAENSMFLTVDARNSEGVVGLEMRVAELMHDAYMRTANTAVQISRESVRSHAYLTPNAQAKWRKSVEDSRHMSIYKEHIPGESYVIDSPAVPASLLNDFEQRCPVPMSASDQSMVDELRILRRRQISTNLLQKQCGCGKYQTHGWPCPCAACAILSHGNTSAGRNDPRFDPSTREFVQSFFSAELWSDSLSDAFPHDGMRYQKPSWESLQERPCVRPPLPIGEHEGTNYRRRRPQQNRFAGNTHADRHNAASRQHVHHHRFGRALASDPNVCSRCKCTSHTEPRCLHERSAPAWNAMTTAFSQKHGKLWLCKSSGGCDYLPTDVQVRGLKKAERQQNARPVLPSAGVVQRGARAENCHLEACAEARQKEDDSLRPTISAFVRSHSSSVAVPTVQNIARPYLEASHRAQEKTTSVRAGGMQAKLQAAVLNKNYNAASCKPWLEIQTAEEREWLSRHTLNYRSYPRKFLEDNFVYGYYTDKGRGAPTFKTVAEVREWIQTQDDLSLTRGWNPAFWTRFKFMNMPTLHVLPRQGTLHHESKHDVCCTLPILRRAGEGSEAGAGTPSGSGTGGRSGGAVSLRGVGGSVQAGQGVATEVGARAGREDEVGSPPSVLNTRPLTDRQHLLTELANTSDNDTRTRILQQLHALTRHRQSQLDPKT